MSMMLLMDWWCWCVDLYCKTGVMVMMWWCWNQWLFLKWVCCLLSVSSVEIRTLKPLKYPRKPPVDTSTKNFKGGYKFNQVPMHFKKLTASFLNTMSIYFKQYPNFFINIRIVHGCILTKNISVIVELYTKMGQKP